MARVLGSNLEWGIDTEAIEEENCLLTCFSAWFSTPAWFLHVILLKYVLSSAIGSSWPSLEGNQEQQLLVSMKTDAVTMEIRVDVPQKFKQDLLHYSLTSLLGIYPKDSEYYSRYGCSSMFIDALLTIARKGNQPAYQSPDESILQILYICTMDYYLTIKKNGFLR